jgi:hypothetical protein
VIVFAVARLNVASSRVPRGRLVVVAATADSVARPSCQHEYHADDQEDDPDDEQEMRVGEGGDQGREDQPEDDKDDSEDNHDIYLVSMRVVQKYLERGLVFERVF